MRFEENELAEFFNELHRDAFVAAETVRAEDNAVNRRNLARATFAFIEGSVSFFSYVVYSDEMLRSKLDSIEVKAIEGKNIVVRENGSVKEFDVKVPLMNRVRMLLKILTRAYGLTTTEDFFIEAHGWHEFRKAIRIRDRVTHPRRVKDLEISNLDMRSIYCANYWVTFSMYFILFCAGVRGHNELGRLLDDGSISIIAESKMRGIKEEFAKNEGFFEQVAIALFRLAPLIGKTTGSVKEEMRKYL